jgi:signal transduction histidine kinase
MGHRISRLLFLLASLWGSCARAQVPLLHHYTPENAPNFSSVFALVQDDQDRVYVSGRNGLFRYDGSTWEPIASVTNHVRALAKTDDGTIMVGTVADFGYLRPLASGQMVYVPLSDQLTPEERVLPTIWEIHVIGPDIYFIHQRFIFWFKKSADSTYRKVASIRSEPGIDYLLSFVANRRLYATEINENGSLSNFTAIEGAKKTLLYSNLTDEASHIFGLVALNQQELLLFTSQKGTFSFHLGTRKMAKKAFPADSTLQRAKVYCALKLKNGQIAIGTELGGLVVVDTAGNVLHQVSEADQLPVNLVYTLLEDRQGNLWLGLGQGLAKVALSLPFTNFNQAHQAKNRVHCLHQATDGNLYQGNDVGVWRLAGTRFARIAGTEAQHWQLLRHGQGLLSAGGNLGVCYLEAGLLKQRLTLANSVMQIAVSRRDSTLLYVATYGGLRVVSFKGGRLVDLGLLKATQADCRSLYELPDGRLWVGTSNDGFFLISFPEGNQTPAQVAKAQVAHHTKGLRELKHNRVMALGQRPIFASQTGLYTFDEAQARFRPANLLPVDFAQPRYQNPVLQEDRRGQIWLLSGLTIARKLPQGGYEIDSTSLLPVGKPANQLVENPDGTYWLTTPEAVFRFDPAANRPPVSFGTLIAQVGLPNSDSLLALGSAPTLDYAHNSLLFRFSAPSLWQEKDNQYQYWLENYDPQWSAWTPLAQKEYTNLREGTYTFRVRSRNALGQLGREASFSFTIRAPWYRTWWAYLAYLAAGAGLLRLAVVLYTRQLRQEKEKLATQVHLRTREIAAQNQLLGQQRDEILGQQAELIAQKEEIQLQAEELARMNATKDKLFSIISHDLKSPFSRLSGILRLLDMDGLSQEEFVYYAKQLRKNTDTLYGTLDNLLRWSMMQMNKSLAANLQPIDLGDLCQQVGLFYEENLTDKKIELANEVPLGITAHADPEQVKLILRNLLTNAIKFTHQGGQIRLTCTPSEEWINVSVADQGVGMDSAQVNRLFMASGSGSGVGTSGERGTGLGLVLVKEFVENNGGTISVQSAPGQGTTFTFTLRRGKPQVEGLS